MDFTPLGVLWSGYANAAGPRPRQRCYSYRAWRSVYTGVWTFENELLHRFNLEQILVHDSSGGWIPGQHVRLCALFDNRIMEAHPLTISSAPSDISVCNADGEIETMILVTRVCGDWSRALNKYAIEFPMSKTEDFQDESGDRGRIAGPNGALIQATIDGPYGGCSIDIGDFEHVVLFAGGSGITFMLGLLDDIVGRSIRKGEQLLTKRIELIWCVRALGESLNSNCN